MTTADVFVGAVATWVLLVFVLMEIGWIGGASHAWRHGWS